MFGGSGGKRKTKPRPASPVQKREGSPRRKSLLSRVASLGSWRSPRHGTLDDYDERTVFVVEKPLHHENAAVAQQPAEKRAKKGDSTQAPENTHKGDVSTKKEASTRGSPPHSSPRLSPPEASTRTSPPRTSPRLSPPEASTRSPEVSTPCSRASKFSSGSFTETRRVAVFTERKLGVRLALVYDEASDRRAFAVNDVSAACPFAGWLHRGAELTAINDEPVPEASDEAFDRVIRTIATAPRPLELEFRVLCGCDVGVETAALRDAARASTLAARASVRDAQIEFCADLVLGRARAAAFDAQTGADEMVRTACARHETANIVAEAAKARHVVEAAAQKIDKKRRLKAGAALALALRTGDPNALTLAARCRVFIGGAEHAASTLLARPALEAMASRLDELKFGAVVEGPLGIQSSNRVHCDDPDLFDDEDVEVIDLPMPSVGPPSPLICADLDDEALAFDVDLDLLTGDDDAPSGQRHSSSWGFPPTPWTASGLDYAEPALSPDHLASPLSSVGCASPPSPTTTVFCPPQQLQQQQQHSLAAAAERALLRVNNNNNNNITKQQQKN